MGQNYLTIVDVCRILGEEYHRKQQIRAGVPEHEIDLTHARPLKPRSIYTRLNGQRAGTRAQYVNFPMPEPNHPHGPNRRGTNPTLWEPGPGETVADVEERLRAWYRSLPGPGAGGGRRASDEAGPADRPRRRQPRRDTAPERP